MKKQDSFAAAVVTIKDAADMTPEGRREIAEWLRRQAKDLMKDGDRYHHVFRARFYR